MDNSTRSLPAAGCRKIFADKKSGKDAFRPELKSCHAFLDAGETLMFPSLDRYRSCQVDGCCLLVAGAIPRHCFKRLMHRSTRHRRTGGVTVLVAVPDRRVGQCLGGGDFSVERAGRLVTKSSAVDDHEIPHVRRVPRHVIPHPRGHVSAWGRRS
ncbi:hypothetical protein [Streptomyces sp. NPDC058476]|uniref:hypothetical protein n=1 Tax=Streptomyces sp. NPDC058476 TaxID=3346519 RepID=UPI00364D206B